MSDSLKIGGFTLFAEVISNIATSFASLRYSSIPLKGALSVIQNATGVIAGLAGQIASPYVAENKNAEARRVIIKRQFLWGGIVPGLCAAGISLGIPRTLSTMLGGEGTANLSDSELYSNISLIFSISLLGNLLDLLYQTLIDRGHTRTPGVISSIGFTCIIPLCFVFENLLAETDYEDAVGNFAILASILFTLIGLGCYYKRLPEGEPTREERRPEYALLLMDHDAAAAAVDVRSVVEEAELA